LDQSIECVGRAEATGAIDRIKKLSCLSIARQGDAVTALLVIKKNMNQVGRVSQKNEREESMVQAAPKQKNKVEKSAGRIQW
jgi:hypothetical protein